MKRDHQQSTSGRFGYGTETHRVSGDRDDSSEILKVLGKDRRTNNAIRIKNEHVIQGHGTATSASGSRPGTRVPVQIKIHCWLARTNVRSELQAGLKLALSTHSEHMPNSMT